MSTVRNFFYSTVAFALLAVQSHGQISKLSVYGGGGLMYYLGDLKESTMPNFKSMGWNVGVGINYPILWRFSTTATFNYGYITGADKFSDQESRRNRNLYFKSNIFNMDLRLSFDFLNTDKIFLTPYAFAGAGVFHFNPKAEDGTALQPLGTEGQYAKSSGMPKPYKLWQLNVPVGLGLKFKLNCRFAIRAEVCYHKTFTDYLDDASTVYVDKDILATSPNPSQTIKYADMKTNPENSYTSRGNPKKNDSFVDIGLYLEIKLGSCRPKSRTRYKNVRWL